MPSFAMCADIGCDMRSVCRRHRARSNADQTRFDPSPREPQWTSCEYLDPVTHATKAGMRTMEEIEGEAVA